MKCLAERILQTSLASHIKQQRIQDTRSRLTLDLNQHYRAVCAHTGNTSVIFGALYAINNNITNNEYTKIAVA